MTRRQFETEDLYAIEEALAYNISMAGPDGSYGGGECTEEEKAAYEQMKVALTKVSRLIERRESP
jgi:hypothetical protein